jgi:hypothetical protein
MFLAKVSLSERYAHITISVREIERNFINRKYSSGYKITNTLLLRSNVKLYGSESYSYTIAVIVRD